MTRLTGGAGESVARRHRGQQLPARGLYQLKSGILHGFLIRQRLIPPLETLREQLGAVHALFDDGAVGDGSQLRLPRLAHLLGLHHQVDEAHEQHISLLLVTLLYVPLAQLGQLQRRLDQPCGEIKN